MEHSLTEGKRNALDIMGSLSAQYEALAFLCGEGASQGRYLSRAARQVLHENDFDGTNHADVANSINGEAHLDALSIQVRSGWATAEAYPGLPESFEILLHTNGPGCRLIGSLNDCGGPEDTRIEYQDFGPWTELRGDTVNDDALDWFASACSFYWSEIGRP